MQKLKNKYKVFNVLMLVMLMGQLFTPIVVGATPASKWNDFSDSVGENNYNQYFMLTVLEIDDDSSYGLKTTVQNDKSASITEGNSYDAESAQSNYHQSVSPIIDAEAYNGRDSAYKDYITNIDDFDEKNNSFPNSWSGINDDSLDSSTRYGASPEEGEYGLQVATYLSQQLQSAYNFIAFGEGYKSGDETDIEYIQDLANLAACGNQALTGKGICNKSNTIPLSDDSSMKGEEGVSDKVTYTVSKPDENADAELLDQFKFPSFYNQSLTNKQKANLTVKITVTSPDGSGETIESLFAYKLDRGYSTYGALRAALKNNVAEANVDYTETELDDEVTKLASSMSTYYNWSYIMEMVMYSYAEGDVRTSADLYKLDNTMDSCVGEGRWWEYIKGRGCLISAGAGNAVYYGTLAAFGIPSIPYFISPYGEFSNWWYGFIPPNLTGFIFTLFGFMVIFAAATKVFTLLAKYRNADKSVDQHSEFKDYFKSIGLYVITLIFFVVLLFVFLGLYDYVAQAIWQSLNGGKASVIGDNNRLSVTPADMTGTGAFIFSFFYIFGTATWYLTNVFFRFRLAITLVLAPVIAEEIITTDKETSGFNRFVELFVDTFVILFINLMAFLLLYVIGNSTLGGTTIVLAVFLLGICASMFTIIMKRLGISKRLLNLPDGAIFTGMATGAMKSVTNEAQGAARGAAGATSGAAQSLEKDVAEGIKADGKLTDKAEEMALTAKTANNAVGKEMMAEKLNSMRDNSAEIEAERASKLDTAQKLHAASAGLSLLAGDGGGAIKSAFNSHSTGSKTNKLGGVDESKVGQLMSGENLDTDTSILGKETTDIDYKNQTGDTSQVSVSDGIKATAYALNENDGTIDAFTNLDKLGGNALMGDLNLVSPINAQDFLSGAFDDENTGDRISAVMNDEGVAGFTRTFDGENGSVTANYDNGGNFTGFNGQDNMSSSQLASANASLASRGGATLASSHIDKATSLQESRLNNINNGLSRPRHDTLTSDSKTPTQLDPTTRKNGGVGSSVKFNSDGQAIMHTKTEVVSGAGVQIENGGHSYTATIQNGRGVATPTEQLVHATQQANHNIKTLTPTQHEEAKENARKYENSDDLYDSATAFLDDDAISNL